jgi:hypothetical protein
MSGRRAASVFPEPVGAIIRTFSPLTTSGMASAWGGVGLEIPVSWRRLIKGGESRVKASGMAGTSRRRSYSSSFWKINLLGHEK